MTTTLKTCFKCLEEKPLGAFYKHPKMADGHLNKCKKCACADARAHRRNPKYRERVLAYDRQRGNRQTDEYNAQYKAGKPRAHAARNAVGNAIRDGKLIRGEQCEVCGSENHLHAHHDDYAKPLDVRWLCASCHSRWHAKHGEAANAK